MQADLAESRDLEVADLKHRLYSETNAAAAVVFERYSGRLLALAQSRIGRRLAQKVDPDDVVQSVFRTFFRRVAVGKAEFRGFEELWGLLALMTIRRCRRRAARFTAACRDVRAETAIGAAAETAGRDPVPYAEVEFAEELEAVLSSLKDRDRDAIALMLAGHSAAAAAAAVGCSERTLQRVVVRLRAVAERREAGERFRTYRPALFN